MKGREGVCSSARTALQSPAQGRLALAMPDRGGFLEGERRGGKGREGSGGRGKGRGGGREGGGRGGREGGKGRM